MSRKRLLLLVFIITALSLMTYQSNRYHLLPFKFLDGVFTRFHDMKSSLKESITSPFRRMLLREEENRRLKGEITRLLQEQQLCLEVTLENKSFRKLLALRENERRYVTSAKVIARSADQWSNTIVINKGISDGIAKDMTAITDKGLAGKIIHASGSYAHLLLLTDIHFSASARLQQSRSEGVITGTGFRKCWLRYIPHEEQIKDGDVVITSGLDLLFPEGIPIGYVSKVGKTGSGFFQDIEVTPYIEDNKIEFVTVIRKE
jgi:rod shape-determining protein MreC